jgi:hypothetical protein
MLNHPENGLQFQSIFSSVTERQPVAFDLFWDVAEIVQSIQLKNCEDEMCNVHPPRSCDASTFV